MPGVPDKGALIPVRAMLVKRLEKILIMSPFSAALNYQTYQNLSDLALPARLAARQLAPWLQHGLGWFPTSVTLRRALAACEVVALAGLTHARPSFRIEQVHTPAGAVPVQEEVVASTDFCSLIHFRKSGQSPAGPRVLLVAPASGHFATLLRGTIQTLLQDHDVFVTDWHNVRDIPVAAGPFDLDAFIRHVIHFVEVLGPGTHVMAVCQPTVPVLAAAAVMHEDGHPARPASLTLLAGPIDCRINPTEVNQLATSRPLEWFEKNLISVVPMRCRGAFRRVYPGYLQISAFMSMNMDKHQDSFRAMYGHFLEGETVKAHGIRDFYDEYLATMDLPAEFYLQTVKKVFQEYHLPQGKLHYAGRLVRPECIRDGGLFTVEGEKDDICGLGQTHAAHALCSQLPAHLHQHYVQEGAGHYGVFNGRRWEQQIYPRIRAFIGSRETARRSGAELLEQGRAQQPQG